MKLILVARKALEAYLIISAEATSVSTPGASSGAYREATRWRTSGSPGADHHPVGLQKVADSRTLPQELGVRAVADVSVPAPGEVGLDGRSGAHGHGRLDDQQAGAVFGRQVLDDLPDAGEVGVAGMGGRGVDADEDELARRVGLRRIVGEVQAIPMLGHELGQPRLVDGHVARPQSLDLEGVQVHAGDSVAQAGQTDGGDQADVAGADHRDALCLLHDPPHTSLGGHTARGPFGRARRCGPGGRASVR